MSDRFLIREESIRNFGICTPRSCVIIDSVTGVNYLYVYSDWGASVTPLLDASGKPIITK